jgi:thiol-disulfide isomerase/thioredoxin
MKEGSHPVQAGVDAPLRRMALLRIAAALGLLTTLAACDWLSTPVPESPHFVEGRTVPPELLALISGQGAAAQALRGKMLVLNIWATWCGPCRIEMPSLNRLSKLLDPQKFAVVGVSTDTDGLLVSEFLLQNGISYSNFWDPAGKVLRQLGLTTYPDTLVIAPDHTLVRRITGLREWSSPEMVKFIEDLYPALPGSGPTMPHVPK